MSSLSLKKISRELKALEKELSLCTRCGMCQSVCPLYSETGREQDSARGKLALLDGLLTSILSDPEGVLRLLQRCLLCGACAAHCPRKVNSLSVFLGARMIITEITGMNPLKRAVLKAVCSSPALFDRLVDIISFVQKRISSGVEGSKDYSCIRDGFRNKKRIARNLAEKSFSDITGKVDYSVSGARGRVLFYPGCLVNRMFPEVGTASLDAIISCGYDVVVPEGLVCCGMPAAASGDMMSSSLAVHINTEIIKAENCDFIVTSCPTCAFAMKKLWPLSLAEKKISMEFFEKIIDISEFIVRYGKVASFSGNPDYPERAVTVHDPCHLKRSLGIYKEPRILVEMAGCRISEMKNADRCCGMGGTFSISHYDLSMSVADSKIQSVLASGADTVAAACPACMMQIGAGLAACGSGIRVRHPVEIFAERVPSVFRI